MYMHALISAYLEQVFDLLRPNKTDLKILGRVGTHNFFYCFLCIKLCFFPQET